jgi:hypothetical protein
MYGRYISWESDSSIDLADGDQITIENNTTNRQAVFFEGAVFFIAGDENLSREREESTQTSRAVSRIPLCKSRGPAAGERCGIGVHPA